MAGRRLARRHRRASQARTRCAATNRRLPPAARPAGRPQAGREPAEPTPARGASLDRSKLDRCGGSMARTAHRAPRTSRTGWREPAAFRSRALAAPRSGLLVESTRLRERQSVLHGAGAGRVEASCWLRCTLVSRSQREIQRQLKPGRGHPRAQSIEDRVRQARPLECTSIVGNKSGRRARPRRQRACSAHRDLCPARSR
jgi:hypothetical protein